MFGERDYFDYLRWSAAGTIVFGAHAGLVATYFLFHQPDRAPTGAPVVLVELAPLPSAPQPAAIDVPPEPRVEAEPTPEPENVPDPPTEVAETKPVEPEPEPEPDSEPVQTIAEKPPEVIPPKPEVVTQAIPLPELPSPKPVERPKKKEQAKPKAKRPPPRRQASAPAQSEAAAAPQFGLTAETSRAQASWRDLVVAHLQRNKRYPSAAQARRDQGTVILGFTVDRKGHVLSHHIARGSGVSELDVEVRAMIQRADPLPAFPPTMGQSRVSLSVPIRFSLR